MRILSSWADKQHEARKEYEEELESQQMNAADNWATMAVQGAGMGAATGNPYAALAGGLIGGAMGMYGGYQTRKELGDKNAFTGTLGGGIKQLGSPRGMQSMAGATEGFSQLGKGMSTGKLTPEQKYLEAITQDTTRGLSLGGGQLNNDLGPVTTSSRPGTWGGQHNTGLRFG